MKRFAVMGLTNSDFIHIYKLFDVPKGKVCPPVDKETMRANASFHHHCDSIEEARVKALEFNRERGASVVLIRDQRANKGVGFYDDEKLKDLEILLK